MAENVDRSMNAELIDGMCDGTYKRVIMNRSLWPDPDRRLERASKLALNHGTNGYGIAEAPEKRTPDGRFSHDQGFIPPLFPEVTVRATMTPEARQVLRSERN
jgi:hypothetical protein